MFRGQARGRDFTPLLRGMAFMCGGGVNPFASAVSIVRIGAPSVPYTVY